MTLPQAGHPIGIFDSGVGGLTVLKAVRERLPAEDIIYLGDTARLPYGTKSPASVQRYASHAAGWLAAHNIKLLVVACNTATALALDSLRAQLSPVPVIGVVEPGAAAAVAQSKNQRHLVLATESTVRQEAYTGAIRALAGEAQVEELACSLFVALAEEGWGDDPVAIAVAEKYLDGVRRRAPADQPDTAILGCTHFPLVRDAIAHVLGPDIAIVDSATTTAAAVAEQLEQMNLLTAQEVPGRLQLVATDSPARFADIGSAFLGEAFSVADIELTDIHPMDAVS